MGRSGVVDLMKVTSGGSVGVLSSVGFGLRQEDVLRGVEQTYRVLSTEFEFQSVCLVEVEGICV
jgi:hypothetical protein